MRQPKIFYLLQKAHSSLFRASDQWLRRNEAISTAQQAILLVLSQKDGLPISDIAKMLSMGNSSLTGLVDRMSREGLVSRRKCEDDLRSNRVFIEEKGRDLIQRTLPQTKKVNEALLAPFSAEERKTIERFLLHVCESADKELYSNKID